jgi:ApbE superfamily uncharacterized protein (UPF0280 family)
MVAPSWRQEKDDKDFVERTYRDFASKGTWVAFAAASKETDLYIRAEQDLTQEALEAIHRARRSIEGYIRDHPGFRTSLQPLPIDPEAPQIVRDMLLAAQSLSVGPMAAVAGAIAESVGTSLQAFSPDVIVENGGDVFLATQRETTVGVFAGRSPLSMRLGLRIPPEETPCGLCTSSGQVGPSLSFGRADAVTVWASSTALADAAATALANRVVEPEDIEPTLDVAKSTEGLKGALVVLRDRIGVWGPIELVRLNH